METVNAILRPNIVAAPAAAGLKSSFKEETVIKQTTTRASTPTSTPGKSQQRQQQQQTNIISLEKAATIVDEVDEKKHKQQEAKFDLKDFELLSKEYQEQKSRTRKLQLEIDEKNEIIIVLKEELETSKEQSDKYQRENLQLVKDAKRAKDLQDELDCLHSRLGNVEQLEHENKKLKDRLEEKAKELEFFNIRVSELEKDRNEAQEESQNFEEQCRKAESRLSKVDDLEKELQKWKLFSHELEAERNSIQGKLLESIEQENKLNSINEKVEDEVRRLRTLIRTYEEEKSINTINNNDLNGSLSDTNNQSSLQDTSIKFELDKHIELELNEENRGLKQKLNEKESSLREAISANKEIRDELEGNRKLISDLRQDLACEKSFAQKLTKELTSFRKQIRQLDKQYFPINDGHESNGKSRLEHKQVAEQEDKPGDKIKVMGDTGNTNGINVESIVVESARDHDEASASDRMELTPSRATEHESEKPANESNNTEQQAKIEIKTCEEATSREANKSQQLVVAVGADKDQFQSEAVLASQSSRQLIDQVPHERLTVGLMIQQQHHHHSSGTATTTATTTSGNSCSNNSSLLYPAQNQQQPTTAPTTSVHAAASLAVTSVVEQQQQVSGDGGISKAPLQPQPQPQSQPLMVNKAGDLTEKQIAHLTSLHQQHYYHHLQHMHQLHQMHHLHLHHHRLHHEYQQQQTKQQQGHAPGNCVPSAQAAKSSSLARQDSTAAQTGRAAGLPAESTRPQLCGPTRGPIYSGGSQFYAPAVQQLSNRQQLYANTISGASGCASNDLVSQHNHLLHHHHHHHHPHDHLYNNQTHLSSNKLVSNNSNSDNSSSNGGSLRSSPIRQHGARLSPQKMSAHHSHHPSAASYIGLPQIDEVNGLANHDGNQMSRQQTGAQLASSVAAQRKLEARKHNSNGLPSSASPCSSSSSPTSSGSSRRSPNSSASSSSSSLSSLSPSGLPLNRGGALRHTTTNVSRRQLSIERDLVSGNMPMTATLSRTGSCRVNNIRPMRANHDDIQTIIQPTITTNHQQTASYVQMRSPVKSLQPTMRASKILNISQQQPQQPQQLSPGQVHQLQQRQSQNLHHQQQQQQQQQQQNAQSQTPIASQQQRQKSGEQNKSSLSAARSSMERFTSNLANIRLKDSLAFASLRMPKKSSAAALNGASLNDSHTSNGQASSTTSTKLAAHIAAATLARNSPERRRQFNIAGAAAATTTNDDNNNIKSNASSSNKSSSVFFEYGCV